jgi:hypothetical protein
VKRLYAFTYGIGAACVGAAGVMLSLVIDVTPALGPAYTLLRQRRRQVEMQETMGEVFALFPRLAERRR